MYDECLPGKNSIAARLFHYFDKRSGMVNNPWKKKRTKNSHSMDVCPFYDEDYRHLPLKGTIKQQTEHRVEIVMDECQRERDSFHFFQFDMHVHKHHSTILRPLEDQD